MRPTFLVIGAQKAGTTSMHTYLGAHPQVFVSKQKELNFFTDLAYGRGMAWYEAQFDEAGDALARGEVSPFYTSWPWQQDVPVRVAEHLPEVRLVYLLRHPIERMLSNYRHHVALGIEDRPLADALLTDTWQYLDRSRYALQLEQWLEHVPRERILVATAEDLRADRDATMRTVFRFIGVDPDYPVTDAPELNTAEEQRNERQAVSRLKSSRLWPMARALVPASARDVLWRRVGSRPLEESVQRLELTDDLRRELVERLAPDLRRLRVQVAPDLGTDFPCWGLLDG